MKIVLIWIVALIGLGACSTNLPSSFSKPSVIQVATMVQDWRNVPDYQNYMDFTYATLSPRAQTAGGPVGGTQAADQLVAQGVKVLFMIRPCYQRYQGQPLPVGDFNRTMEDLAAKYGADLLNPDGTKALAPDECYVVDYRNDAFVNALVDFWVRTLAVGSGVLHHEACGNMNYYPTLSQISQTTWDAWQTGFFLFVRKLRAARSDWEFQGVCDQWELNATQLAPRSDLYDGLFFEQMGGTLDPIGPKVFNQLSIGTRNVIALYNTAYPLSYRRGAAAMAIVKDALFLYGSEATVTKDVEHFGIHYGTFSAAAKEVATGVWERIGTHGLVVFNESGASYDYTDPIKGNTFSIGDGDGLSAQFKDKSTDADLATWITNVGQ